MVVSDIPWTTSHPSLLHWPEPSVVVLTKEKRALGRDWNFLVPDFAWFRPERLTKNVPAQDTRLVINSFTNLESALQGFLTADIDTVLCLMEKSRSVLGLFRKRTGILAHFSAVILQNNNLKWPSSACFGEHEGQCLIFHIRLWNWTLSLHYSKFLDQ